MSPADLARLERVARLRADTELKRFAAFRRHVAGLRAESQRLEAELLAEAARGAPATVAEARMAHALTRHTAGERLAAEGEIDRLAPAFAAARLAAVREFGRAEVIAELGRRAEQARTLDRRRREP